MKEFQLIRKIQQETSVREGKDSDAGVRLGIGDDAAVLDLPPGLHLVASTDTLNVGVHFPTDTAPVDIGHKCLAVNLSDLASMGAVPRWVLLSLSLPTADSQWLQSFTTGFNSLANRCNVSLVGGDTTSGPLSVNLTALGVIEPGMQLMRSGAEPGDLIIVSGRLGGAARVLQMILAGEETSQRHLLDRPIPRIKLGQALVGFASACIDISDGLLADLGHLVEASGCGAHIDIGELPAAEILDDLEDLSSWQFQLTGGDDYELLFTLPCRHEAMLGKWRAELNIELAIIGRITGGNTVVCLSPDEEEFHPEIPGFEHFRSN